MEIFLREQNSRMARQSSTEMITVVAISARVIRSDRLEIPMCSDVIPNGLFILALSW